MYEVEMYLRLRRACMVEGMSVREASRVFGLHRDTVRKMLEYSVPPGYRRESPPRKPKLEAFTGVVDAILEGDTRVPRKQRHTAKRIFERLRDEYGFTGQYTIVKDYVRGHRRRSQEMFVPLSHAPGHAQCDFGEALAVIGGVERKIHYLVMDLPHSDGCFVKAYPAETTEAFLDGHVAWTLRISGGVSEGIHQSVVQSGGEFLRIGVAGRPGETLRRQPQVAAHQGDGVDEGRRRFVVPGRSTLDHGVAFLQRVGGQGDPGKESQQDRRGAGDGQVGPLALGLHAQMGPHLLKSDLQLPAQHEPFQDLRRVCRRVGAQQGLGREGALWVSDQHPANAHRGFARAVPDCGLGGEFHSAGGAVVPAHRGAGPGYLRLVSSRGLLKERFQRGSSCALQRWAAVLTRLTGWRGRIEGGIQAQSGDQGNGFRQGLAAVQQVEHSVAVVPHQHQRPLRQPAAQLQDHLACPVGELLVPTSSLLIVPRRWRQHREHRQGPMASRPGHLAQPHQGDPAQTTGFDHLGAAGTHRITVNAQSAVPRQLFLPKKRPLFLPVHPLGLAPLLGGISPVAGDVKLQDHGVVHDPVNRRGGGHGVGEDALPL